LSALRDICGEDDIVLIHDGNRAMVPQDVISDAIAVAILRGCAISIVPCNEVIVISHDNSSSSQSLDRSSTKRTQTPHVFQYKKIREIYEKAIETDAKAVAACDLMIQLGETIYFSKGSEKNIKITTLEDIEIFRALLRVEKSAYLRE
jgi:2-C-methyl-D-erythritol 4-phosphate cytidylyltransferase